MFVGPLQSDCTNGLKMEEARDNISRMRKEIGLQITKRGDLT